MYFQQNSSQENNCEDVYTQASFFLYNSTQQSTGYGLNEDVLFN